MPIENFQNKKISIWAANCDACDKKEEGQKEEQLVKLPCWEEEHHLEFWFVPFFLCWFLSSNIFSMCTHALLLLLLLVICDLFFHIFKKVWLTHSFTYFASPSSFSWPGLFIIVNSSNCWGWQWHLIQFSFIWLVYLPSPSAPSTSPNSSPLPQGPSSKT